MQLGRDFVRALAQITKERGLSQEVIASSLEAALISAYKKYQGGNQDVEVHIDTENGDISICEVKHIVADVVSPDTEISLADAQAQGCVAGFLDHGAVRAGVGKGHAQLDHVRARGDHAVHQLGGDVGKREAGRDVGNQRLALLRLERRKGGFDAAHDATLASCSLPLTA